MPARFIQLLSKHVFEEQKKKVHETLYKRPIEVVQVGVLYRTKEAMPLPNL